MTRINAGIPPSLLSDKHLLSEHREIKRIPNHLRKHGIDCLKNAPEKFTLGTGHFLFFLDKAIYTSERYLELYNECKKRGFKVTWFGKAWKAYNKHQRLIKNWRPSRKDTALIIARLQEKDSKFYANLKSKVYEKTA